jgi:hypothetical protein
LAELMPARLIDNHYWNNPIFSIVEPDGKSRLPASVWDRANDVRAAVLETIATLAPAGRNFIFAHAVTRSAGRPIDHMVAGQILNTAERRRARTLLVRLRRQARELRLRIVSPERAERLKERDPARADAYASLSPFDLNHNWTIDFDTTRATPSETASMILRALSEND